KPLKRCFTFAPNGFRFEDALGRLHGVAWIPCQAALGEEQRALRCGKFAEEFANDFFRMSQSVDGSRVDPVDAQIQGMAHGRNGIGVVLRPPAEGPSATANGPRTKPHGCNLESARTQRTRWQTHDGTSQSSMKK